MIIESSNNSKIKYIRKLEQKKYRYKEQKYLIEGVRIIDHALDINADIEMILFSTKVFDVNGGKQLIKRIYSENIDYYQVDEHVFEEVSNTYNSQGVIAIVNIQSLMDEINYKGLSNKILFINQIQDPGNLGTIIRTADSAGFNDIIITKGTVDPYNDKVIRATMGSVLNVNIYFIEDNNKVLNDLKTEGYQVIATALDGQKQYNTVEYNQKIVLCVGNEGNGLAPEVIDHATIKVNIPIFGSAESLNVGVASGIMMYKINESIEK